MKRLFPAFSAAAVMSVLASCQSFSGKETLDAEDDAALDNRQHRLESPAPFGPESGRVKTPKNLPAIRFDSGKWEPSRAEDRKLDEVIKWLNGRPERVVLTATASGDSEEYARQLGEMRARTVSDALVSGGIPRERISAVSYGTHTPGSQPVDSVGFSIVLTGSESEVPQP